MVQDAHPLTVNPGAGKATNLDADKVDGQEASSFVSQADLNAEKLWAVVEDDSEGKGNLVRGSGVSSVGGGSGSWDVTFNRDVSSCAWVATWRGNFFAPWGETGVQAGNLSNTVVVHTHTSAGPNPGHAFHLIVLC